MIVGGNRSGAIARNIKKAPRHQSHLGDLFTGVEKKVETWTNCRIDKGTTGRMGKQTYPNKK